MSITSDILDKIEEKVNEVTGVENVYPRRVVYADQKQLADKFKTQADNSYLGFMIYRSGKTSELISFKNKVRHHYLFTISGLIGTEEDGDTISYNTLRDLLEEIEDHLSENLTLDGEVTDSEFPEIGDIDLQSAVGKTFWVGEITWLIHKDVLKGNIS